MEECCGMHAVCEKTLTEGPKIVYYDDEQLDVLADRLTSTYTDDEYAELRYVFDTLRRDDLPGWLQSLDMRHISLPGDIHDEALMLMEELAQDLAQTTKS